MTGDVMGRDPDAVVIVHHPLGGGPAYGVGPFPPIDGLVEQLLTAKQCDCRVEALWIGFPKGIRMVIGVDTEGIESMVEDILGATNSDRLN
jgi:hypothetical protein